MAWVLAMIPLVIDDQIITVGQLPPERKIGINGKPIAMAKNQPPPVRVAMPAKPDDGAVHHRQIQALVRFGQGESHAGSHRR